MLLTPAEQGRLLLYLAALLARERLGRGLQLNVPEATALIAHAACETARDGGRLADAVAAGRAALQPANVLPGVAAILDEVQVEAVFDDGTKLIVIRDPLGAAPTSGAMPGEILPGEAPDPPIRDVVRVTVVNTSQVTVTVTSHFPFIEANRALAFDRAAAYGRRLHLPAGSTQRFEPGVAVGVELVPIGGARQQIGFAGLVDGPLDDDGVRERALARLRASGYQDTGSPAEENIA